MPHCKIRSFLATRETVDPKWFHVDAKDCVLGRLAVNIATVLMGKHKPTYTPHVDTGDFVVVTNADKVRITGRKKETMEYQRYSHHPGGLKVIPYERYVQKHPEKVLVESVRRMLPKNGMGHRMLTKLKVYTADTHPHSAQQPAEWRF